MMQNNDIIIRTASVSDAQQILDIYAPYVLNTAITFEYEVPSGPGRLWLDGRGFHLFERKCAGLRVGKTAL